MCGLVGIISRRPAGLGMKQNDIFENMLMFDTLRGKDSTGVIDIKNDGSVDIMKQAEQPFYMFRTKQWENFKSRSFGSGRILAGHNRAATRGQVTNDNAHPFYEKNIVLMHNGTLDPGWESLTKEVIQVDSHAICHALATGTPQDVLPKVKGAFALLWYNLETETFHAIRNDERPLCLITTAEHYYLASESWMATIPCMRAGIKIEDSIMLEPGDLHSWTLYGKMEVTKIRLDEPVPSNIRYNTWLKNQGYASWEDDVEGEWWGAAPTKQTQVTHAPVSNIPKDTTRDCSPSCALLENKDNKTGWPYPKQTDTTKTDSATSKNDSEPEGKSLSNLEAQQSSLIVEDPNLPKGREVMVKIWNVSHLPNGGLKWTGKLAEPGLELLDVMGFLPRGTTPPEWGSYLDNVCLGKIHHVTKTVCGPVVYVNETKRIEQTMVNSGKLIPEKLWEHAHTRCTCRDCGQKVEDWEKDWTSVKLKGIFGMTKSGSPLNTIEMICPDCIMRSLDGDFYATYTRGYYNKRNAVVASRKGQPATCRYHPAPEPKDSSNPAVQDREPLSGEPVGKNGSVIVVPGSPLIQ